MADILYLVHRLPYPPDKGDKVRSFHLLEQLARHHRVHLGTFVDDPADEQHVDALRERCAGLHVVRLRPAWARLRSLLGLAAGDALTLRYYRDAGLRRWVAQTLDEQRIDAAVVFSSAMAQYVQGLDCPVLVDLVDVDSSKWSEYARHFRWPLSWLYRREGRRLLDHERRSAARAARAYLVTDQEAELFRSLAPECAASVESLGNGVDAKYFAPAAGRASPYASGEQAIVFTGAMDYWPNVDAVRWFASEVLPRIRERRPAARLHVVGRNPTPAVRALAGDAVAVSGTVPDVRPWLQHAAAVVAPLRLARGVQNKVLEAMAMGRPVVAAEACTRAIDARPGVELLSASDAATYIGAIDALISDPEGAARIGRAARSCVLRNYSWDARLAPIQHRIDGLLAAAAGA